MGARAFNLINLVQFKDSEVAVEIGSERGEGSTAYLADYLKDKAPFYTVDVIQRTPQTIVSDGADWLNSVELPIKFCYLDNFDYIFPHIVDAPWVEEQKQEYASIGLEETNENSEKAHLLQAMRLNELAVDGCLVVIDDTWVEGKEFKGKGAQATPYLIKHGWKVINEPADDYTGFVALRKGKK